MALFFKTRRSVYFNIALFFLLIAIWCFSYSQLVLRSFFKEEHLFYGKVSYAAIPSIFGGSNIPFLDKTFFQINGDGNATFILYSSKELTDGMSDWFNFAAKNANDIPLEISAVRLGNKYIVKSLASTYGNLDWLDLSAYHLFWSLVVLGIISVSGIGMLIFLILAYKRKKQ